MILSSFLRSDFSRSPKEHSPIAWHIHNYIYLSVIKLFNLQNSCIFGGFSSPQILQFCLLTSYTNFKMWFIKKDDYLRNISWLFSDLIDKDTSFESMFSSNSCNFLVPTAIIYLSAVWSSTGPHHCKPSTIYLMVLSDEWLYWR